MDHANAGLNNHSTITDLIDLASARLGGRALATSDDFFAEKENLLKPEKAIFIAGKFTERGKWMDGWESRRKRVPGHDWCIIEIGRPGSFVGFNVDTSHFNGNQPEACTVDAAELAPGADPLASNIAWTTVLDHSPLKPSSEHVLPVNPAFAARRFTHVRLNIFPDGGVARFRVHGHVLPDWKAISARGQVIDLAAADNAGLVIAANDMHFGSRHNMIMPGRAVNMGDGWETRRKRGLKGGEHDWAIVKLGHRGLIESIEVDTNHFKGNFPDRCQLELCDAGAHASGVFDAEAQNWRVVLPQTKLRASEQHLYRTELDKAAIATPCTHVRIKIYPDGGISRLRINGRPVL